MAQRELAFALCGPMPRLAVGRLHRVKTYCLSQSYLSFALTADTTRRDNCGVRQARPHSPCGLTLSMKTFQPGPSSQPAAVFLAVRLSPVPEV